MAESSQPTQPAASSQSAPTQPAASVQPAPPQPAVPVPPAPAPVQPERHSVHHSYIWLGGIHAALTILTIMILSSLSSVAALISEGFSLVDSGFAWAVFALVALAILGFLLLIGLVFLSLWWSYRHLYYEIGDAEFSLYSGIFNKKRIHVPYHRIQSVDQHATFLQRALGVCDVGIDTAGGSSNKAIKIPYLQKATAEELRRELFARKNFAVVSQKGTSPASSYSKGSSQYAPPLAGQVPAHPEHLIGEQAAIHKDNILDGAAGVWDEFSGVFGGEAVDTGQVSYEHGLTNKELVLTGLSNATAFAMIVFGVLVGVIELVGFFAPSVGSVEQVSNGLALVGFASFAVFAVFLWIASGVMTCVRLGGFKARRRGTRIETEYGLLQHQIQGVEIERVQSVIVKQSVIRRLFGYCEVSLGKVEAAVDGSKGSKSGMATSGLVIHPFVRLDRVPEILEGLAPEFSEMPTSNISLAPAAFRRAVIRRGVLQNAGFWLAVCIAIVQIVANVALATPGLTYLNWAAFAGYALCMVISALKVSSAILWFRGSGFAYNDAFMCIRNAGLSCETTSFSRKKIQFGYTKANPLQKQALTATIHARTAAGTGGTTIRLIDVTIGDAQEWLTWLKPRGNVVE